MQSAVLRGKSLGRVPTPFHTEVHKASRTPLFYSSAACFMIKRRAKEPPSPTPPAVILSGRPELPPICKTNQAVTQWHDLNVAGNFDDCVSSATLPEPTTPSPFDSKSPADLVDRELRDLIIKYECCDWIDMDDAVVKEKIRERRIAKRGMSSVRWWHSATQSR
jgi:hypothetical protein